MRDAYTIIEKSIAGLALSALLTTGSTVPEKKMSFNKSAWWWPFLE
jgi:hypothetical protein